MHMLCYLMKQAVNEHERERERERDRKQVVCEYPDRSRTRGNSQSGPVSWMTEHAPDLDKNTTYKTRQELLQEQEQEQEQEQGQGLDQHNGWTVSLTPTPPPPASTSPSRSRTDAISSMASVGFKANGGARRPSRPSTLGAPPPTSPAPSSESPRTSSFREDRQATAAIACQEEEEEYPRRPSYLGPAKEVVQCCIFLFAAKTVVRFKVSFTHESLAFATKEKQDLSRRGP